MNAILGFHNSCIGILHCPHNKNDLNTINRSGEHLLALINDILEISQIEANKAKLQPISLDLHDFLNDLVMMFQIQTRQKDLQFKLEMDPNVPRIIITDENKLRQILINILGNSIKFTQEGGIALRIKVEEKPQQVMHLIMEIEDTGVGIADDELHRVFQSFEQTTSGQKSKTGTGLGMAISREHARMMGGDITVNSVVGKGSVFTVEVSVIEGKADNMVEKKTSTFHYRISSRPKSSQDVGR